MCWGLANTLVFKKVRTALGFDRCKYFFSGAAPITKDTIDFFLSLNITIQDIYGMSESTGKLSTFYMSVNQSTGRNRLLPQFENNHSGHIRHERINR